jgi:hypothetical protein
VSARRVARGRRNPAALDLDEERGSMSWIDWNTRLIATTLLGLSSLCADAPAQDSASSPPEEQPTAVEELVAASNRMAWKLASRQPAEGSRLVSPLPVMVELRKLAAGARGETLRELQAAAGVPETVRD